ncbi:MAG: 50S ribosomal protein L24 [Eubacteriales bacterium]|nr:50S ribosomal protein L24 [Eubacteriales bacterium]
MKLHVKTNDEVMVITGKDRGVKGKVLKAFPKTGRVIVEGASVATKHQKSRAQGQPGGIIKKETPIDASNVMLVCQKCGKPSRYGKKVLDNGNKVRICKKCGEQMD